MVLALSGGTIRAPFRDTLGDILGAHLLPFCPLFWGWPTNGVSAITGFKLIKVSIQLWLQPAGSKQCPLDSIEIQHLFVSFQLSFTTTTPDPAGAFETETRLKEILYTRNEEQIT